MYLLFKKWAFEVRHCGKFIFEYSREHRQQRWYVTVMDRKTKVMMAKTLMDEQMDTESGCKFDAFLNEAVPALEEFILNMPKEGEEDGEAEAIQSEEERETEPAWDEEDEPAGRED